MSHAFGLEPPLPSLVYSSRDSRRISIRRRWGGGGDAAKSARDGRYRSAARRASRETRESDSRVTMRRERAAEMRIAGSDGVLNSSALALPRCKRVDLHRTPSGAGPRRLAYSGNGRWGGRAGHRKLYR